MSPSLSKSEDIYSYIPWRNCATAGVLFGKRWLSFMTSLLISDSFFVSLTVCCISLRISASNSSDYSEKSIPNFFLIVEEIWSDLICRIGFKMKTWPLLDMMSFVDKLACICEKRYLQALSVYWVFDAYPNYGLLESSYKGNWRSVDS